MCTGVMLRMIVARLILRLPDEASAKLASAGHVAVKRVVNGHPFRTVFGLVVSISQRAPTRACRRIANSWKLCEDCEP